MLLAEHQQTPPSTTESQSGDNVEQIKLSDNVASWQSSGKTIEEQAVVHKQPGTQRVAKIDDDEDDDDDDEEDSFTYPSSDEEEVDENKQKWVAKRLPEIAQPSINNQVSNSNKVNINNTNKNVYEGNVVIHQTFISSAPNGVGNHDGIDVMPVQKITDKDPEAAVSRSPKLSNVSSHPLYPFEKEQVTSWCTKKRLIIISGAVLVGIALIVLLVNLLTPGKCENRDCTDEIPSDNSSIPPTVSDEKYILGVPYVDRKKWDAQPSDAPPDKFVEYPPPYVIIAHTATSFCYERSTCVDMVKSIQIYHIEQSDVGDIGYNFLVGGDGDIYEGRGWDVVGAHTYRYNRKSMGVAFIGDFKKKVPTDLQLYAAEKIIEYGLQNGKIATNYTLLGHRQCIATESPGEKLYQIIKTWPNWSPKP